MVATLSPSPESTLTERYQTTVPSSIREVLGLNKRDKIRYTIQSDGKVLLSRADDTDSDPVLGEFLNFLSRDITNNPQLIKSISPDLASRIQSLSLDADIDLDELLLDEDE